MSKQPQPGNSFCQKVYDYFRRNPDESLDTTSISIKFGVPRASIPESLDWSVEQGLLLQFVEGGLDVYSRGPNLMLTSDAVPVLPLRDVPPREIKRPLEADPHGKSPSDVGAKLDHGKNRLGLVLGDFSRALEEVGLVGSFGAKKYTVSGWIEVPNGIDRYTDAMYRHLMAYARDDLRDNDSGLLHLSHACWNLLAVLDLTLRREVPQ